MTNNKIKFTYNYQGFEGVTLLESPVYLDSRGSFQETYNSTIASILPDFKPIQNNISKSVYGTMRGMHWDDGPCRKSKLVTCVYGYVLDFFVDIRPNSPTYKKIGYAELTSSTIHDLGDTIFIPDGFAHGFLAVNEYCETNVVNYLVDGEFDPQFSRSFNYKSLVNRMQSGLEPIDGNTKFQLDAVLQEFIDRNAIIISEKDDMALPFEKMENLFIINK